MTELIIRPELKSFVEQMELTLRENDNKLGLTYNCIDENLTKILRHVEEIINIRAYYGCYKRYPEALIKPCIDIANYSLMIYLRAMEYEDES